jgi:hypothetical protein
VAVDKFAHKVEKSKKTKKEWAQVGDKATLNYAHNGIGSSALRTM